MHWSGLQMQPDRQVRVKEEEQSWQTEPARNEEVCIREQLKPTILLFS